MLILAALWRFGSLPERVDQETIEEYIDTIGHLWWTPVIVPVTYLLAHAFLFPNTILNTAVILTIGGWRGWLYAIGASLFSSTVYFLIGKRFGAVGIHALEGRRVERVRRTLKRGGFGAVALVRLAPVAPYTVVNTLAGAIELRYVDFLVGTFLAHLPGTLALAVFGEQLTAALRRPSVATIAAAIALAVAGLAVLLLMRRYAHRRLSRSSESEDTGDRAG
jgi:uncharacterized membrane protein YdjX (TVP38/TMEM64 family)